MTEQTTPNEINKGITLKCHRCLYVWRYKGVSVWFTSCPRCKTTIRTTLKHDNTKQKI
jgi:hypothetical protein